MWTYDKLEAPFGTTIYKSMKERFGDVASMEGVFRFAWDSSAELGKWCSDRAWKHALGDDVLPKLEGKITKLLNSDTPKQIPNSAYKEIESIKEASEAIEHHEFNHPSVPGELSPKVQLLRNKLEEEFGHPTESKCIVFTQKRYTAKILHELFSTLEIPHLRPGVLVGVGSGDMAGMNITFRQQFVALVKFRNGEINCLVRTQRAGPAGEQF